MEKDPVCGMKIDEKTAAARTQYKGTTYYFCAHGCLRVFLQEPEKYVGRISPPDQRAGKSIQTKTLEGFSTQLRKS